MYVCVLSEGRKTTKSPTLSVFLLAIKFYYYYHYSYLCIALVKADRKAFYQIGLIIVLIIFVTLIVLVPIFCVRLLHDIYLLW